MKAMYKFLCICQGLPHKNCIMHIISYIFSNNYRTYTVQVVPTVLRWSGVKGIAPLKERSDIQQFNQVISRNANL